MKKCIKLAAISTLLALGIGAANAQNTNVVLASNISLSGFKQVSDSNAATVRITNKDILADLNANGFSFGRTARLVILSSPGSNPVFQVRENTGTNVTITDISGALTISPSDTEVVGRNGVHYTILNFTFNDSNGTSFTVSGFATLRHGRISGRGIGSVDDQPLSAAVQVAGSGTVGGDDAVLKGTISAASPKLELD